MANNLFETQYDVTKKSKLKEFYDSKKILIYSLIILTIIIFGSLSYYQDIKEKKKIQLSENYIQAKVYLNEDKKAEALSILKKTIYLNDEVYSTLSFFMILNQNLIDNNEEILSLFNHLLINNKFDEEIKNLLIYKKALYSSNFLKESELLNEVKPLLREENLWKPHVLLLLGDYFASKKEFIKAKEFYIQILSTDGLQKDLYDQATSKIALIPNE